MGLIQNLLKGIGKDRKEFKEKLKQAEEEMRINKMLEERQKSSNERELERYMKEEKERQIKEELDMIHHKQNQDLWKSNTILKKDKSILKDDRPILKEKNIFVDNKNKIPLQKTREGMFFRW